MEHPLRAFALAGTAFVAGGMLGLAASQLRAPQVASSPANVEAAADGEASSLPVVGARPPAEPEGLELPAPGTVVVRRDANGISVLANASPRFDVLIVLANSLGFDLIDRTRTNPEMTLRLVHLTAEEILTRVLDDTPYRLRYQVAEDEPGVEIAVLEVAPSRFDFRPEDDFDIAEGDETSDEEQGSDQKEVEEHVARMGPRRILDAVGRREFEEARAARNARRREETLEELAAVDPDTREFAASQLDAERAEDLVYLADLLKNDQDPGVRREAAQQLAFGDDREVVAALEGALNDPDEGVVRTSIDSLGFFGDASAIPRLQPFLNHPDIELRHRAQSAIDLLSTSQ